MVGRAILTPARWAAVVVAVAGMAAAADEPSAATAAASVTESHADAMARMGLVRHSGSWRTPQEIALIERGEQAAAAERDWAKRLERLRRELEKPASAARAAEELAEISDPRAVPALVATIRTDPAARPRALGVAALSRIAAPEAFAALVSVALDHPDAETRIAAVERLAALGPGLAVPALVAALAGPDNARINRAAEALGRIGDRSAVAALIASLETRHVAAPAGGPAPGATSATFTPSGGGLSMGGGPPRAPVTIRNERVLEALVALTGTSFGWDVAAWRAWLATTESPPPDYDPRRG
jgi:hypothetical protein